MVNFLENLQKCSENLQKFYFLKFGKTIGHFKTILLNLKTFRSFKKFTKYGYEKLMKIFQNIDKFLRYLIKH